VLSARLSPMTNTVAPFFITTSPDLNSATQRYLTTLGGSAGFAGDGAGAAPLPGGAGAAPRVDAAAISCAKRLASIYEKSKHNANKIKSLAPVAQITRRREAERSYVICLGTIDILLSWQCLAGTFGQTTRESAGDITLEARRSG
jgi:hypothetical protein